MNGITRVGLAALLGAGIALGGAATASADMPVGSTSDAHAGYAGDLSPRAMWTDISPVSSGTYADAGSLAVTVCNKLDAGYSELEVMYAMNARSMSTARRVVYSAEFHFCADHY